MEESILIVSLYLELRDWERTKSKILQEDSLPFRRKTSLKRKLREIIPRLQKLSEEELEFFRDSATPLERSYLLWMAVCKNYPFIENFAISVLRERFLHLGNSLDYTDFNYYFSRLIPFHPELEKITQSTYLKLRRSLFLIMKEAQILNQKFEIQRELPSKEFIAMTFLKHPETLQYFPLNESYVLLK